MSAKLTDDDLNLTEISKYVPNRFLLCIACAKRARQLQDGAVPLINVPETMNPIRIALLEIQFGLLNVSIEDTISEDDSLIDEISDYLDTDAVEVPAPVTEDSPVDKKEKKESKSKRKSLTA